MALPAVLVGLLGCSNQPSNEDTRHLERPPPKPPHCPDSPELKNITLGDGTIADVRIVQFNPNAKLYVPSSWFTGVDKVFRPGGFAPRRVLQLFAPDIHSVECPGIIHHFVAEAPNSKRSRPVIGVEIRDDLHDRAVNISLESDITNLRITTRQEDESAELYMITGGISHDALVLLPYDLVALLRTRQGYGQKVVSSSSLVDFVEWLRTPPAIRDNNREFDLKVDGI